jgi:hypothetical protein
MAVKTQPVTELQLKAALEPITREVNDMKFVVNDMKKTLTGNGSGIGLDEQVRNNRGDIERMREDVRKFSEFMETLKPVVVFYRVGLWFFSALGISVVTLIWGLITGRVELTTP